MNNPYNKTDIDLNIDNYSIIDILELLDINTKELLTISDDKIKEIISIRINKLKNKFKLLDLPNYVKFFDQINKKILYDDNDNDNDNSDYSNIYGNNVTNIESQKNIVIDNIDSKKKEINFLTNFSKHSDYLGKFYRNFIDKTIIIDSRYRDNYKNTDSCNFIFTLKEPIKNIIELKLLDIEFKNSFYPINSDHENNFFWIKITNNTDSSYKYLYIYLKDNWYDDHQLINLINSNLNINNINNKIYGNKKINIINSNDNYTIELNFNAIQITNFEYLDYNDQTIIMYLIEDNDYDIYYNTNSNNDIKSCLGFMFGFIKQYYSFTDNLYSENIIDLTGPRYFYLYVNEYSNNFNSTLFPPFQNYNINNYILTKISKNEDPYILNHYSTNLYNFNKPPRLYNGPINIEKIEIKIFDEFGRIMNLNGYDICISFNIKYLYVN